MATKKKVSKSESKVKAKKEFLLFPVNLYEEVDGMINGHAVYGRVKKFGKEYFKVKA